MSNASTVGALRVVLGLDSAAFEGGISKAQKHLRTASKQMQDTGLKIATAGAAATATITTAFAALGFHLLQGSQDAAAAAGQVKAALESMGSASGRTFDQLAKTAEGLRNLSGIDDDEILTKVTANLLTFGNVTKDVFDRAQLSILNISARMKTDLLGSTMMVGKALNDPIKGLAALRRVGIQFTDAQEKMIKSMVAANDIAGAQGIMLGELERQFGGAAEAAGNADVWKPLKTALMDLEGAFEPLVRDVMAPLIQQVAELTRYFADLSPQTQKFVLVGGAIAAAMGPALIAIGSVVAAVGSLTSAFAAGGVFAAGGALSGIGAGFTAIAAAAGPVAIVVAAAVGAFLLFRDDVQPVLESLWKTAQATLGPALGALFEQVKALVVQVVAGFQAFGETGVGKTLGWLAATLTNVFGTLLIRVLTAAVQTITGAVQLIGNALSVIGDLLTGDFSGAWEGAKRLVVGVVQTISQVFQTLAPEVIGWISRMVSGVTDWLQGKLFAVLRGVIERVKGVSDAFFRLYDAVVGHSYVPDMVTEVGQWMAKLDQLMVQPASKATKDTAEAFEELQRRASAALQKVMTDRERLAVQFQSDMREIADLERNRGLTAEQAALIRSRTQANYARDSAGLDAAGLSLPGLPDVSSLADDPGVRRLNEAWRGIQDKIKQSREDFADSFSWGLQSALRGDWSSRLQSILSATFDNAFKTLGRSLFDSLGGGSPGGFSFGNLGSLFSKALSWLPGFQHGGSIREGGAGGIDSQLVAFWKSPSERVDIYEPGGDRGPMGGVVFDLRGAVMTDDLLRQMRQIGRTSEDRANTWSTKNVPGLSQSQTAKQQQYTVGRKKR